MKIEIPDDCLEPMREMPAVSNSGKYKKIKNGGVLAWMGRTDKLCTAVVIVRRAMMQRAEQLGIIKYDSDTNTWQGVDNHGR